VELVVSDFLARLANPTPALAALFLIPPENPRLRLTIGDKR
jgi:hypothetical protein